LVRRHAAELNGEGGSSDVTRLEVDMKSAFGIHKSQIGFTLVELLVVITIILVLLAMLTPALDRAIYQAELAVCQANLHAIGTMALTYGAEYRRQYPSREGVAGSRGVARDADWNASRLQLGLTHNGGAKNADQQLDERPVIAPYLSINRALRDPLTQAVDLEADQREATIFAGYDLWYSWRFDGFRAMSRIGDRFTLNTPQLGRTYEWNLLAGDLNGETVSSRGYQASHHDADGVMPSVAYQSELIDVGLFGVAAGRLTFSRWQTPVSGGGIERGDVDLNYAYDDGSTGQITDVGTSYDNEERMVPVWPGTTSFFYPDLRQYIPGVYAR
jgi:prepilin-type N-terminal cleavage/methylation domain-containing protein